MSGENPKLFDHFAEAYDRATSIERTHDYVLEHLPKTRGRVLDVGCGSGLLSAALASRFDQVVGLDISGPLLEIARQKRSAPNISYLLQDAETFQIRQPFDAIVSHTTFHHFADVAAILEPLKRGLSRQGRLIVVDCVKGPLHFASRLSAAYWAYAAARWPSDSRKFSLSQAGELFRFRTSRPWIAHRRSDRLLSQDEFLALYGRALPGARFDRMKSFMGVVWDNED